MEIAAYCRVSTDKEEQLDSLVHQKEFFSAYARQHGHHLVEIYADEGISGTSLKKRTQFQRLLRDAETGKFRMVVVKDVSRFARNTVDFLQSIRRLKALGVNTLFLTADMESLGESEFVLTVFGALAQEESVNLSKRVKFGKRINAQKGRVPRCVFGYDRVDNFTLEKNPSEAEIVREIYRKYLEEGMGCRSISLELNRSNKKTKLGCEWTPKTVRRILSNPLYCGKMINHKYEIADCLEGNQVRLPVNQHFCHERPEWAIISEEVFTRVQALLAERRSEHEGVGARGAERHSDRHLFSGLIHCAECGRMFYQKHYTYVNTRVYWKCQTNDRFTSKVCENRVTVTEELLVSALRSYFLSSVPNKDKWIDGVLRELERKNECVQAADRMADLQKRLLQWQTKKEKYREMYTVDLLTMAELKEKNEYIDGEMEQIREELSQCQDENSEMTERARMRMEAERFLSLENVTNRDLRRIVHSISVNRKGEITIYLQSFSELPNV